MISERDKVEALLNQALAEARSRGADRITQLHFMTYGASQDTEANLRNILHELSVNTPAEGAGIITHRGPNQFICYNCCALRFETDEEEATCPNCGHLATRIPPEIKFALDHIEVSDGER